jgi:uncharacterized membrane protein YbhN (UPF0104 family)
MGVSASTDAEQLRENDAEMDRGAEFEPRALLRRSLPAFIAIAVLILIALLAPGLGDVRQLVFEADPGWIALAVLLEGLSFGSYIVMFAPIFCRGMSWRRSWQIGGSELAMGSIIPASGAGGLALGAWVLHEGGMDGDLIARRSVAFFLIKSSVNFVAVAVLGLAMWLGLFGSDEPWTLTLLPAALSILLIAAVLAIPRLGPGADPPVGSMRMRRVICAARRALFTGVAVAVERVRSGNLRIIAGSIGYWLFDNAVLWATFHAFGYTPDISIVLMGYLIGQLGGLLPIPGGIGGIDGGLIGTLIVYGAPAAEVAAAVLAYRVILFWLPLFVGAIAFFDLRREMPSGDELAVRDAAAPATA